MTQYTDYAKFRLVVRPYDETHVIRHERFSKHLAKCAKNYNTVKNFASCEDNYTHKIKRGDSCEHYKHCSEGQSY
jgi:hypothetical protein